MSRKQGLLTRRSFVAATAASAAIPILSGAQEARAQQPKHGGRLRNGFAVGGSTDRLDPAIMLDNYIKNLNYQVRECLCELSPDLTATPELAESWESSDAKTWRFKLRSGVTFHNGKPFTAEDVIWSINYHRGAESKSQVRTLANQIDDIKADGPLNVVFTLKAADADFPLIMTDWHFTIMPADTKDANDGVGTGPYALQQWEPGVRALTKKYAGYWRKDRGFFDEVESLVINDATARLNALLSGQVDVINRVPLKTISQVSASPNLKVINTQGTRGLNLAMLTDAAPYNNPDLREAMKFAIDRKQIVDNIMQGYGRAGNDNPLIPAHRFYNNQLPERPYDPEKARFHLKKSGMEGQTFELHTAEVYDGLVDLTQLYQQSAAKAGINIKLTRVPVDGYWRSVWIKVPFCVSYFASRPSEHVHLSLFYAKGSGLNETKWDHPRFNELLASARGELDEAKRKQMFFEMQKIIVEESGNIVPVWGNYINATSSKVQTPAKVSGAFENDGDRSSCRWWFA